MHSVFNTYVQSFLLCTIECSYLLTTMSVGHLDYVLTVYSSMEHVTWKSPGPMCGWVGRILHPDSSISLSSWSKVPLLSIWSVAVPLCRPLLSCPSRWHGYLPRHGLWWLTCELGLCVTHNSAISQTMPWKRTMSLTGTRQKWSTERHSDRPDG